MAGDTTVIRRMEEARGATDATEQRKRALRILLLTGTIRSAYEYAERMGAKGELEDLAFPEPESGTERGCSAVALLAREALEYSVTYGNISRMVGKAATPLVAASELWDSLYLLKTQERDFPRQRLIVELVHAAEHNDPFGSRMRFASSVFLKCLRQTSDEEDLQIEAHYRLRDENYTLEGFMAWVKLQPLCDQHIVYRTVNYDVCWAPEGQEMRDRAKEVCELLKEQLRP